jgi:mycothiol synthase
VGTLTRRPFTDADLRPLQSTVAGWIAQVGRCGYDHIGELPHRVYENLRPANRRGRQLDDLVHLWMADQGIEGLTICLRFGSAFDVLLAPGSRGTSVERELIEDAYATTARHVDPAEQYVNTDVFSCDGSRIDALQATGFERYRVWDEVRERDLDRTDAPEVPARFRVRAARMSDADGLAAARTASFDQSWTGPQYRDDVMSRPGYDPKREIVAVAPDGTIAAYTVFWTDERNQIGHIEPLGTHREFRRLGLGRAGIVEALRRMRDAGMTSVSVNHNADNIAARRLYASLGFTVRFQTYGYRRPV